MRFVLERRPHKDNSTKKQRYFSVSVDPLGDGWNNLKLTVADSLFTVYLNNKQLFQVKDETFKNAGKIGLWTKADAVSYFDELQVKEIKKTE